MNVRFWYSCIERLENTTLLHDWGGAKTRNDITYQGPGMLYQLNPDILYPLAKTYVSFSTGDISRLVSAVSFRHESNQQLSEGAQLAARLTYDSSK